MDNTNVQQLEEKVREMESKIEEMKMTIDRLDKQQIKIVGDFDGTSALVTVNGIRRKIATVAP